MHIFCHQNLLYPFEPDGDDNWMARYFFSGGLMPAADTLLYFQDDLRIEQRWGVSGTSYQKTARAWLANMDANSARSRRRLRRPMDLQTPLAGRNAGACSSWHARKCSVTGTVRNGWCVTTGLAGGTKLLAPLWYRR
jgi:hypothetical protein